MHYAKLVFYTFAFYVILMFVKDTFPGLYRFLGIYEQFNGK